MCLAAKHLLWFPVSFCRFNLLVSRMFRFCFYLPLCLLQTQLSRKAGGSIPAGPPSCPSGPGCFNCWGRKGGRSEAGLCSPLPAHSGGSTFSKRNGLSLSSFRCLLESHTSLWRGNRESGQKRLRRTVRHLGPEAARSSQNPPAGRLPPHPEHCHVAQEVCPVSAVSYSGLF